MEIFPCDQLNLQQLLSLGGIVSRVGNGIKDTAVSGANAVADTASNVYNGGFTGAGKYISKNGQIAFEKAGETMLTMTPAKAATLFKRGNLALIDYNAFLYNQSLNGVKIAWKTVDPKTYDKYDEMIEAGQLSDKEIKMVRDVYWEGGKLTMEFCATFTEDPRCAAAASGMEAVDAVEDSKLVLLNMDKRHKKHKKGKKHHNLYLY